MDYDSEEPAAETIGILHDIVHRLDVIQHDDAETLQALREKVAWSIMVVEANMSTIGDTMRELRRILPT